MSAVEKVAQAVSESGHARDWADAMEIGRIAATAMLDDMAEPSEGMLEAWWSAPDTPSLVWKAMLTQYRKEMGDAFCDI